MHNRYIHYVLDKQLGQGCKQCRLEYFQLLAVCAAGRAGRGEELDQQTPPTSGHTCPAPGLSGQQVFCCNSGCGCQKRQSLIINKKTLLCVALETILVATNFSSWHHCRQDTAESITFLWIFFFARNQQYL